MPAASRWSGGDPAAFWRLSIVEFQRIQPSPPLRDVVESIWLQDDRSVGGPRTASCVVPTGTVEILFHYGDRFSHLEPDPVPLLPRSYVTGQRSRPVFPLPTGRIGIVLASLYPWGLASLFPGCVDVADGYLDLGLVASGSRVAELEERLMAAGDSAARVELVESFLTARRTASRGDARMITAARWLASSSAPHPVHETAGRLAMSRRHFARLFRSTIGLPPKTFSRIMRFQRAMRLHRHGALPWAMIAAECGYTDQAHLIHEVRHFSARTPGGVEIERDSADDFFNGNSVSRFFNTIYL